MFQYRCHLSVQGDVYFKDKTAMRKSYLNNIVLIPLSVRHIILWHPLLVLNTYSLYVPISILMIDRNALARWEMHVYPHFKSSNMDSEFIFKQVVRRHGAKYRTISSQIEWMWNLHIVLKCTKRLMQRGSNDANFKAIEKKFDFQSTRFQGFIRSYDNTSTHDEIIQIKRDNNNQ